MSAFTESIVEDDALAWLEGLGYAAAGAAIAPVGKAAERRDYGQIALADRLRRASPTLISGALRVPDGERIVGRAIGS